MRKPQAPHNSHLRHINETLILRCDHSRSSSYTLNARLHAGYSVLLRGFRVCNPNGNVSVVARNQQLAKRSRASSIQWNATSARERPYSTCTISVSDEFFSRISQHCVSRIPIFGNTTQRHHDCRSMIITPLADLFVLILRIVAKFGIIICDCVCGFFLFTRECCMFDDNDDVSHKAPVCIVLIKNTHAHSH